MRRALGTLAALVTLIAITLAGCDSDDDDDTFPALVCNDTGCDPACQSLLQHPPDPIKSSCSPPGPICDYDLMGTSWEYACSSAGHIVCAGGGCPGADLGVAD